MKIFTEDALNKMLEDCTDLEAFKSKLAETDSDVVVDSLDLHEGEVVIISFPPDAMDQATIQYLGQLIQTQYPDNPVIGLVNDVDVLVEYPEEVLEMLEGMRAKISILKDTPNTSKIIV